MITTGVTIGGTRLQRPPENSQDATSSRSSFGNVTVPFSATISETRFSHWRRPQASIDHAAVGMFPRLRAA
jgi:hypothetical protein